MNKKIIKVELFANVIGATLDKTLPLIIAIFLTNYMSQDTFGVWTQYLQILIIVSGTIISPVQLFFSREFFQKEDKRVQLYNSPIILGVFLLLFAVLYFFFEDLVQESYSLEMVLVIVLFVFYTLNATYLRFQKKDVSYAKFSLFRMLLFAAIPLYVIINDLELSFRHLVHAFLIAHIPFVFFIGKHIMLSWEIKKDSLKEFLRLLFYGLCTALLSGVDKLIVVEAGYSYEDLSYYAYAIAFASMPSFLIEAVKQYMSPKLYHDLTKNKDYTKKTILLLLKFVVGLIIIQFTLPYCSFQVFQYLGFVNLEFVRSENFFLLLTMFNIGFSFHILYHFLNPYMFFYDKSMYLLILQICAILMYSVCVFTTDDLTDNKLAIYRLLLFLIVVIGTAVPLLSKKLKHKYVFKEL